MVPVVKSLNSVKKAVESVTNYISEGEQELEKRTAVFRISASFWENGVHEWDLNDVRSRATYTDEVKEPQWGGVGLYGLPMPGDLGLNCLLAGRSDACGVCVLM